MSHFNKYHSMELAEHEKLTITGGKRAAVSLFDYKRGILGRLESAFNTRKRNILRYYYQPIQKG